LHHTQDTSNVSVRCKTAVQRQFLAFSIDLVLFYQFIQIAVHYSNCRRSWFTCLGLHNYFFERPCFECNKSSENDFSWT